MGNSSNDCCSNPLKLPIAHAVTDIVVIGFTSEWSISAIIQSAPETHGGNVLVGTGTGTSRSVLPAFT